MNKYCINCGASIQKRGGICPYCGSHSAEKTSKRIDYDFGFSSHSVQWIAVLCVLLCSSAAALFDGTSFFTSDTAVALWFVLIPVLTLIIGILRRKGRASFLVFISFFLAAGLPFTLINLLRLSGHIDDSIGAGALIGAVSSVPYLLGLLIHWRICKIRSKS